MAVQTVTAYTFFGVAPDCSQATLRQAYDAAVARHRPDTAWSTPTAAASKTGMQEVNRWYALVATEEARAAYDLTLQKKQQKQQKKEVKVEASLPYASAKAAGKVRRKPVGSSSSSSSRQAKQQLVLAQPPLLRPVALFCSLVVFLAQAVAVTGGWVQRQTVAAWRRKRVLLRVAGLLALFTAAACLLVGWPVSGTGTRWLGPCALPPPPLAANRHYLQLGLADGSAATPFSTIRKAYHQAIRQHHPDKQQPRTLSWPLPLCSHNRRLQAIGEAYAVLRDPQMRCVYDVQQQRRQSLWLRAPTQTCTHARWTHMLNETPGLATAKDAVVLWHAGQVAVFQTVQSVLASVWASIRGVVRRVVVLCRR